MKPRRFVSTSLFRLRKALRRMWVRTTAFAVLALVAAALSRIIAPLLPDALVKVVHVDAVLDILTVLSSSMLAVTTFSLGVVMSARQAISSNITPRAHQFVAEDQTIQRVLATFMGAFTYALTAQVLLRTGFYAQASSAVILIVTVLVLILVIIAMLAWIEHLTQIGSIPDTVAELEASMTGAIADWKSRPALGACPSPSDAPLPAGATTAVTAEGSGYVQYIDVSALDRLARDAGGQVYVEAAVGAHVIAGGTLCHHSGTIDAETLRDAFTIDSGRTYEQDVRFGIIVLSEIAQRALSPAVNDPGTAIFIIDRITALLGSGGQPAKAEAPDYPNVFIPAVTSADLVMDGYAPIARDGAAMVEIQTRLQKAFAALAGLGDAAMQDAALTASTRAAALAEAALTLEEDRARIATLADRVKRAALKV